MKTRTCPTCTGAGVLIDGAPKRWRATAWARRELAWRRYCTTEVTSPKSLDRWLWYLRWDQAFQKHCA